MKGFSKVQYKVIQEEVPVLGPWVGIEKPDCENASLSFPILNNLGLLFWQVDLVTTVQMRVRTRTIAACEGLNPQTQTRRSCATASGRSRTPSAARSGKCCSYKKNKQ